MNCISEQLNFSPMFRLFTMHSSVFKVLYVQAFVCVILLAKLIRKVFFGQLRAAETEVNKQKHYRISVKSVHVVLVLLTVGAWTPNMPFFNKTNSILLSSERAKKNYPHFILLFTCVYVCVCVCVNKEVVGREGVRLVYAARKALIQSSQSHGKN